jgi:bleomycin hydrolase
MNIRTLIIIACAFLGTIKVYSQADSSSQKEKGYFFNEVLINNATPVKDQHRSSTCWSYASLSFIESELMRKGKPATDLSEMFVFGIVM